MSASELAAAPLQGLLSVSRLDRSRADLPTLLDAVTTIVAESFGFGLVTLTLHRPAWDDFQVAAVHGSEEARRAILGQTLPRDYWEPLLDPQFLHRGAQIVPSSARDWDADAGRWFVPGAQNGSWDPADAFLLPLRRLDGRLLGVLSVNDPVDGRRPGDDEVDLLVAVAAHAAHAIESARLEEESARQRSALGHLFRVSSELTPSSSAEAVLQRICDAVAEALGFRLVVVELADRDLDRYRPVASAGLHLTHEDIELSCPIDRFDAVYHPDFEVEGCYLLESAQARALVGTGPVKFQSRMNGRGPHAWNRHWLIAPLEGIGGDRIGFIWADDPADRLLPSRERLQALRLFADQAAKALQAAEQLRALGEAHSRQAALLESSPLAIIALDRESTVRAWNPAAEELFGWTADEVIGGRLPYVDDDERAELDELLQRLVRGGGPLLYETTRRRQDGRTVDISVSAAALKDASGVPIGIMSMSLDITSRKRTEADLARRNAELEALHGLTLELIEQLDAERVLELIVSRACELLGTSDGWLDLLDPDDGTLTRRIGVGQFAPFVGATIEPREGVAGLVASEGVAHAVANYSTWDARSNRFPSVRAGAVVCVPLETGGEVVGVLGVSHPEPAHGSSEPELALLSRFGQLASLALRNARLYEAAHRELDERRQAEDALRKSQELQRTVLENANDLISLFDVDGHVVYASPSHAEVLGLTGEELAGVHAVDRVHPDDREAAAAALETVRLRGESEYSLRVGHRDGHWISVEGTWKAVPGEKGRPRMLLSTARDVTERLRHEEARAALEEQLHQSQKMEAVGRLAGGIAHDFNNLLTAIAGYGDLALAKLAQDSRARPDVEEIRLAADRAAALTRQLLAFSRRQVLQPRVIDLNEVVVNMESMLRRVLGEDVSLATSLAPGLGPTRADPGQVEQVLMNLAINARDAMPRGGQLMIATAEVELDEAFAKVHVGAVPGEYVLLSVSDTGEGMDRETLDRIFEPFFTTKPQGKGTGLGLSTVYGIVKQTGGHVWVYSEPGLGTTFKVYLPHVADAVEPAPERAAPQRAAAGETVLLVEDETVVRELVQEMLAQAGYAVVAAADGEEALAAAAAHGGDIDVLLTDVVMPGLSGREVADHLLREQPSLRVVFTSGYTEDAIASHGDLGAGAVFLEKPFDAAQLSSTLRAALDAEG